MKHLRYMGEFASVAGVAWRVEVWQEADTAFSVVGGLEFPADAPLVIEWGDKSKEEVICSSVATLKIISPGDRTYEDLYSIEAGRVRMDVYRNTLLYWSGCMDTEFYEEPYETLNGYEVTLTFSDFGILDRLKYDLSGMQTLHGIINYCADRCGISYGGIDSSMVSTQLEASGGALDLKSLKVRSDNFYDEDGEASALAEVIDGILQPLALRMVQRCGKIYVYDLNGLYNKAAVKQIIWDGASQTLGVDKVYNNAKVTWSPYAQSGNLLPTECWTEPVDENATALDTMVGKMSGNSVYLSYHDGTDPDEWGSDDSCFTLWLSKEGKNAEINNSGNSQGGLGGTLFFKTVPQYGGTECEGIALAYSWLRKYRSANPNRELVSRLYAGSIHDLHNGPIEGIPGNTVFKSAEAALSAVDESSSLLVRIGIEMLMDPRENPFENAFNWGEGEWDFANNAYLGSKDWQDQWKARGNYVYVPVLVFFQVEDGRKYYWDNMEIVRGNWERGFTARGLHGTFGEWKLWDSSYRGTRCGYLAWYDPTDLKEGSGVADGWAVNRPAIPPFIEGNLSYPLEKSDAGQYILYPPYGSGKLWVEVLDSGWMIYDAGTRWNGGEASNPLSIWGGVLEGYPPKISHIWMKLPEVEVVNNRPFGMEIEDEEVEYSAELNPSAKEPIEIDTICGTSAEGVPTARGAYFKAADNKQVRRLTRAGRTAPAEELLIGTLYSQYAQRRTTLSGEAQILHDPVVVYKEDNQGDKRFMMAEDVQDVRMDTSEATFVEFRPDEYDKLEVEVETGGD